MVVTGHDIARWRLRTQQLVRPFARTSLDAVGTLLAVQAENPSQSAWAVASRSRAPRQDEIGALLDDGRLIRTHVLRPTWHYVRAEDAGWLLELTGQRVSRTTLQQLQTVLGFDARRLDGATAVVLEALGERPDLTRGELAAELRLRRFETGGQTMMLLLAHLELARLICSGRPRGGEHTYARFEDRVPHSRRLDRDEALEELALRYFSGHGPATERDLAYWATLTLTDVRRGLRRARDRLDSFEHDGRTFWHEPADAPTRSGEPDAHLLQILDELYRGYQDTRWVLDDDGVVPRSRESATGMALVDARLVAAMRRRLNADEVVFTLTPHRTLRAREQQALERAASRYGAYLELAARIEVA